MILKSSKLEFHLAPSALKYFSSFLFKTLPIFILSLSLYQNFKNIITTTYQFEPNVGPLKMSPLLF